MRIIQLKEAWEAYPKDQVLEVDETTAKELIDAGTAMPYVAPHKEAGAEKNDETIMQEYVKAAVSDALSKDKEEAEKQIKDIPAYEQEGYALKGGFKEFGHFLRDVAEISSNGNASKELSDWRRKTTGYAEENQDSMGRFLVPEEFSSQVLQKPYETGAILSRVTKFNMASNVLKIPAIGESSRADGSRAGGFLAYWKDELAQLTEKNAVFEEVRLEVEKLTALAYASNEILEDSVFSFDVLLGQIAANEFTFKLEDAIVEGNGVNKPLGFMNAGCAVGITRSSAAVIVWLDVYTMLSRIFPQSRPNAVWLANLDTFGQLASIKDGNNNAVWLPNSNVGGAPFQTLYGLPVIYSEYCQTLGTAGDLCLVDLSQYLLGTKGTTQNATSMHIKFDYDAMAYRFTLRVDGQPWWNSALTPFHGTNTQSPFIYLGSA